MSASGRESLQRGSTHPTPIRPLPQDVVDRIAAGEVIERPASVVRELLDNALDAGATSVRVEVRQGGLRLIRVADDGTGIQAGDLTLVCQPHTTSKLRSVADLDQVTTLGFRGEALASIAAVAEVEVVSATDGADIAHSLRCAPSDSVSHSVQPRSRGTTVSVRQLFQSQPARRSLLRGPQTELGHILALIRSYALTHPAVRFSLVADGRLVLRTAGAGLDDALAALYGTDAARSLLRLDADTAGDFALGGVVASRAFTFPTRQHVLVAVNGRVIANRTLLSAAEAGYRPLLRKGRHPLLVAALTLPPDHVDANIHPAKAEVLLRDERAVSSLLRAAIHGALSSAPTSVATQVGRPTGSRFTWPVQLMLPAPRQRRGLLLGESRRRYQPPAPDRDGSPIQQVPPLTAICQFDTTLILARTPEGDLYLVDQHRAHERVLYEHILEQRASFGRADGQNPAAVDDDVEPPATSAGQFLLEPLLVELTPRQAEILATRLDELASLGLECQPFGGSVFLVRALPQVAASAHDRAAMASALTREASEEGDDWLDQVCVSLACRSAIRRGQELDSQQQQALLDDLHTIAASALCPHGSPLLVRYSRSFLRRTFEW